MPAIDRCLCGVLVLFICICLVGQLGGMPQAKAGSKAAVSSVLSDALQQPTKKSDRAELKMSLSQALWAALAFEDAKKVAQLLLDGADPNATEEISLMTPLMVSEKADIAKLLIEAGADPNGVDKLGRTVTHHALKMDEAASIVRILGEAGAKIDTSAKEIGGMTPLLCAVQHYVEGQEREETGTAIRILVHLGADTNAVDAAGRSALAIAATNNQPGLIRLLIELGADPLRVMANGKTPLDYAREAKAQDAIKELASPRSGQTRSN